MGINRRVRIGVTGLALTGVAATGAVVAQNAATPPEARYVMDAGTIAGFMGQGDNHELTLRLGSRLPANGAPKADHFMPEGAKLGTSVALETPERSTGDYVPGEYQRPKGRLLLYWGCGAKAGPASRW
jgi:hypothetical protein